VGSGSGLGLESLGITLNKDGSVPVDSGLATAIPGIYAAGDVLGAPALASTGIEQANDAVKRILDYQTEVSDPSAQRIAATSRGCTLEVTGGACGGRFILGLGCVLATKRTLQVC